MANGRILKSTCAILYPAYTATQTNYVHLSIVDILCSDSGC